MYARGEPRLKPLAVDSSGVTLSLTGDAGSTFAVLSSTNLVDWVPLFTGVMANGTTNLVDRSLANRRFFRALTSTPQRPPINVIPQLSPDQADHTLLTVVGAQLIIFQTNGTQITLYVPTNSVVDAQSLAMTQVTNLVGLPFSAGLLAAVQVTPNTLDLFGAALLKFPIPPGTDRRRLVSFTCGNNGSDLRLKEDRILSNEVAIVITRPGIYGTALATPQEVAFVARNVLTPPSPLWAGSGTALICFPGEVLRATQIDHDLSDKQKDLDRDFEKTLSDLRQSQLLGYEVDSASIMQQLISRKCDFYTQTIAPYWREAADNCTLNITLLQWTLGFERSQQLLGVPDAENCTAAYLSSATLCAGFGRCRSEILQCCLAGNQGSGPIRDLFSMVRQMELMAITEVPGCFDSWYPEFLQTQFACTNLPWNGTFSVAGRTNSYSRTDYPGGGFAEQTESVSISFMGAVFQATEQSSADGIVVFLKVSGPFTARHTYDTDIEIPGPCGTGHQTERNEGSVTTEATYLVTIWIDNGQPEYTIEAGLLGNNLGDAIYYPWDTHDDDLVLSPFVPCSSQHDSNTDSSLVGPVVGPSLNGIFPFGLDQATNVVSGSTNGLDPEFSVSPVSVKFDWNFMRRTNQPPGLLNLTTSPPPAPQK